jgi:hypothetical protein
MTHLAHLVRWDIRRFWWLLAVWILLVVVTATLDALWPTLAVERGTRELAGLIGNLLSLAEVLFSVALIAQIVHAHPLVGTTAFWMTRPVVATTVMTSKFVVLGGAMIVMPVLVDAIVMGIYQVPWIDILGISAQTAMLWVMWIVAMMTLAALTPNLAKFALLLGGGLVTAAAAIAVVLALAIYRFEALPSLSTSGGEGESTGGLASFIATVAACLPLLVVQYRTRVRVWSCAIGVAGIVIGYLLNSVLPPPAPVVVIPVWAANPAMLALTANAETVSIEQSRSMRNSPQDWKLARADIRLRGVEPGWTADIAVQNATVHVPGERPLASNLSAHMTSVPVEGQEQHQIDEVMRQLLKVERLIGQSAHGRRENAIALFVREAEINRVAAPSGTYEGRYHVSLTRHAIEAVLPPAPGTTFQNGPYRFRIAQVQLASDSISMLSQESDAVSVFVARPPTTRSLFLRNLRRSEAIPGSSYELRADVTLMRVLPFSTGFGAGEHAGFRARAQAVDFPSTYAAETAALTLDDRWLAEAELVIVRSTREGSVERQLAIANFPIRAN